MALADYRSEMELCQRCSACKFMPLEKVEKYEHVNVCPSISRYNFHAYSGGGRMVFGVAMLENRIGYSDKLLEVVYNCQMCGACDISCKYSMDMEVLEPLYEFRIQCVEDGHTLPALNSVIHCLRKHGTMLPGAKAKRGQWADGLQVNDYSKRKTEVLFHAGCRTCYDKDMWPAAKATVALLQKAGVDLAFGGENELCCGGRAYQMGYKEDFLKTAKQNMERIKKSGAKTLVTGCADCYHAFKVLYDKFEMKLEVLHSTEYLDRLIKAGKLKPAKKVISNVTYQDPCGLGRKGEPYLHWQGKEIPGHRRLFDPPKEFRRGTYGVYQPPRDILKSIPGLKLSEMHRTKEYAWCCGAGGGVRESNPDFASWTAQDRIAEAEETKAEALVTACPGCKRSFIDAVKSSGSNLKIYDAVELVANAI